METNKILSQLIADNNGYLFTAKAVEKGISRQSVTDFAASGNLERVAHGIYITQDTWADSFYILQLRNPKTVFSHESALELHGLTEREQGLTVSVPVGYNATHIREQDVTVHTVVKNNFEVGVTEVKTFFGNTVRVYDKERTICDIIRYKDKMDIQVFSYAIKQYMKSNDKNLHSLAKYGEIFRIGDKLHLYTEVML